MDKFTGAFEAICLHDDHKLGDLAGNDLDPAEQTKAPHFRHGVGGEEPYFMLLFQKSVVVTVSFEEELIVLFLYNILRDKDTAEEDHGQNDSRVYFVKEEFILTQNKP